MLTKMTVSESAELCIRYIYTIKHNGKFRKAIFNGHYRYGSARKSTHYSFTMCDTQRVVFLKSPQNILKFNRVKRYDYK